MAFPFEPTQLRAQLRAFALSSVDDNDSAARIVKPLVLGLYYNQCNDAYLLLFRPVSPPIPSELSADLNNSIPVQLGHLKKYSRKPTLKTSLKKSHRNEKSKNALAVQESRRKSQAESIMTSTTTSTIDEEISDSLVATISLEPSAKKGTRLKDKLKNPLTKLFQKSDRSQHGGSDSDSSTDQIAFESGHESYKSASNSSSKVTSAIDVLFDSSLHKHNMGDGEEVSVVELETVDSPSRQTAQVTLDSSFADTTIDDDTVDEDRIEDDLQESSSDSAFTDIEADSLIDIGSIYEYTVPESYVLEEAKSKFPSRQGRRKGKSGSGSLLGKSGKPLAANSLFTSGTVDIYSKSSSARLDKGTPLLPRRSLFSFEKMYNAVETAPEPKQSNLSMLIDSRSHSSNVNPLNYYSFVNSDIVDGAKKASIDIYVPPRIKPVFKDMQFTANVAITDCIGYILLSLSKLPEYKDQVDYVFMNSNNWRLELIDEDGELYDSTFGVLDRTRLLSSYNCPNLLALCRVTNPAEIASNNKQSPLPLEFKQNLEYHERKMESARNPSSKEDVSPLGSENLNEDSVEVKVSNIPGTSTNTFVSFFVSSKMTVEQLIDHISHLYHVDPTRYWLAEITRDKRMKPTMLIDDTEKGEWKQPANNTAILGDLATNRFKLIPNLSQRIRPMTDVKINTLSYLETGITPSTSTFTPLGITPPVASLEGIFREMTVNLEEKPGQEAKKGNSEKLVDTKLAGSRKDPFSLGDIIHGKVPQLPTSLNTIYFKWRVFRKKSPILNRIEKALIIDGDYIHLAPTDDTNWKKNLYENPFSQSSNTHSTNGNTSSHHHHYLHHYNYSKYYNDSMMKTSSFHITQIIKLKQYKQSKNPNHFKIVIKKENEQGGKESLVKKKYDLEAVNVAQCEEIIEKVKWASQVYNMSNMG